MRLILECNGERKLGRWKGEGLQELDALARSLFAHSQIWPGVQKRIWHGCMIVQSSQTQFENKQYSVTEMVFKSEKMNHLPGDKMFFRNSSERNMNLSHVRWPDCSFLQFSFRGAVFKADTDLVLNEDDVVHVPWVGRMFFD